VEFCPRYLDGFEEIKHLRSRAPEKIFYQICQYPGGKYIINNWGLMKKTILDEVVFILFLSYICI
jgi:hypothetical protein